MANGGISPSGRMLRWLVWRLPLGATKLSVARNTAAATEEGRRIMALVAFGLWVAGFWWGAWLLHDWFGLVAPLQVASLFGLLLIWRIIGYFRRLWVHRHNLQSMAVTAQRQRQMYEVITALPGQMQQWARQGIPSRGGFTVPGMMRHHDPTADEHAKMAREQATESRSWLPEEHRDMPLGDKFEPLISWPGFLRRRRGKRGGQ